MTFPQCGMSQWHAADSHLSGFISSYKFFVKLFLCFLLSWVVSTSSLCSVGGGLGWSLGKADNAPRLFLSLHSGVTLVVFWWPYVVLGWTRIDSKQGKALYLLTLSPAHTSPIWPSLQRTHLSWYGVIVAQCACPPLGPGGLSSNHFLQFFCFFYINIRVSRFFNSQIPAVLSIHLLSFSLNLPLTW